MITFLRSAEQNSTWSRLGAKRHFGETGLQPPKSWEEASVGIRLEEFESRIVARTIRDNEPTQTEEEIQEKEGQLVEALVVATDHLDKLLADAGLSGDDLDAELEQWLGLLANARKVRRELDHVVAKHRAINAEKDVAQDALFRFLSRQGETPKGGSTDFDSLSAGLDRVAARLLNS